VVTSGAARVVEAPGARIPLVGLGTWELRGRGCVGVFELALRLGLRLVDTAELYDNER
jgi:2,5-diketo-D-gluconate reductase B